MKTKLEVGKEYWLDDAKDESGIFVGLDGKTLLFKQSKNCKSYGVNETGYLPFSDIGREYCEVQEEKRWQFTTPISMRCTEEQFNGIKDKLAEMGYRLENIEFSETIEYLCSVYYGVNNSITTLHSSQASDRGRFVFESFNPDLFLALAAMTDKEDGIKGEWWQSTSDKNLLMPTQLINLRNNWWRKATAQEIIEHFNNKEFALPEKWCIKVTVKNSSYLNAFAFTSGYYGLCNFNKYFTSDIVAGVKTGNGYTEITFDQFKKYVLKESEQTCQTIPIPPTKQATLFDDRVEITEWKPKCGETVYYVFECIKKGIVEHSWGIEKYSEELLLNVGKQFIKRTESEAKQLVERLKQAML